MKLLTFIVPGRGILTFNITYSGFHIIQLIQVIDRLTEKLKVTMKENFCKHELLVNSKAVFNLGNFLKIVDDRRPAWLS